MSSATEARERAGTTDSSVPLTPGDRLRGVSLVAQSRNLFTGDSRTVDVKWARPAASVGFLQTMHNNYMTWVPV